MTNNNTYSDSLFKPMWDFLMDQSDWSMIELPDWLLHVKGKNNTELKSLFLKNIYGTQIRALHIINRKAEVILIMGYPLNAAQIPVLAVEYVAFQGKPYVAVTDLQWVHSNETLSRELKETLQENYTRYSQQLSLDHSPPDWASYFSPVCLYSRPQQSTELIPLIAAFKAYWHDWSTHFLCRENNQANASEALHLYQQHHVSHSPGKPFMNTLFGQEWTTRYMEMFIYNSQIDLI
jgi:hypothetical protein